jgi:Leucine-rich repeat (LRR) protein
MGTGNPEWLPKSPWRGSDRLPPRFWLPGLRNLQELYFEGGQLRAVGLPNLKHVTALKGLSFQGSRISDAGLACVKDRTTLTQLWFFGCRGLSDEGVGHFRNLKNLRLLDLRNESFTEKEPAEPRITDAGLTALGGLTKLTYLNLQGQKVTDAGLEKLAELQDLEFLAVSFSGVTDAGLAHLYGMHRLRSLHLYSTRVTPEGRARLKTRLHLLKVY